MEAGISSRPPGPFSICWLNFARHWSCILTCLSSDILSVTDTSINASCDGLAGISRTESPYAWLSLGEATWLNSVRVPDALTTLASLGPLVGHGYPLNVHCSHCHAGPRSTTPPCRPSCPTSAAASDAPAASGAVRRSRGRSGRPQHLARHGYARPSRAASPHGLHQARSRPGGSHQSPSDAFSEALAPLLLRGAAFEHGRALGQGCRSDKRAMLRELGAPLCEGLHACRGPSQRRLAPGPAEGPGRREARQRAAEGQPAVDCRLGAIVARCCPSTARAEAGKYKLGAGSLPADALRI